MTFPTVAATATTNGGTANPYVANLPASISSGDLLFVLYVTDNAGLPTTPAGWTALFSSDTDPVFVGFYKVADGSEGATLSISGGGANSKGAIAYRITGYSGTPEAGTTASGSSNAPNPPSLTPSWGAKDTLWLALCGYKGGAPPGTISAGPTNYTNLISNNNGRCGGAQRQLNATSDDPSAFSDTGSNSWKAQTFGIQGSSGAITQKSLSISNPEAVTTKRVYGKFNALSMAESFSIIRSISHIVAVSWPQSVVLSAGKLYQFVITKINRKVLTQTCGAGQGVAVTTQADLSGTYTIRGEFRNVSANGESNPWNSTWIWWNSDSSLQNGNWVAFQTNHVVVGSQVAGVQNFQYTPADPTGAVGYDGKFHNFKIDVRGADADIYLDGLLLYQLNSGSPHYQAGYISGRIGLYNEAAITKIRAMSVGFDDAAPGTYTGTSAIGANWKNLFNTSVIDPSAEWLVTLQNSLGHVYGFVQAQKVTLRRASQKIFTPIIAQTILLARNMTKLISTPVAQLVSLIHGLPRTMTLLRNPQTVSIVKAVQKILAIGSGGSPIVFNWGNGSSGTGGSITGTSCTVGVTNKAGNNGAIAQGDALVAILHLGQTATDPGSPAASMEALGFTTIQDHFDVTTPSRTWVGVKIAGVGEIGSYAASWGSSSPGVMWQLLDFGNVDQNNPVDVSAIAQYANSGTHNVPSISPNFGNDYWLAISCRNGANGPDTAVAPLVNLYDNNGNSSSGRPELVSGGYQLPSNSATGVGAFTQNAFTQASQGVSIGLKTAPSTAMLITLTVLRNKVLNIATTQSISIVRAAKKIISIVQAQSIVVSRPIVHSISLLQSQLLVFFKGVSKLFNMTQAQSFAGNIFGKAGNRLFLMTQAQVITLPGRAIKKIISIIPASPGTSIDPDSGHDVSPSLTFVDRAFSLVPNSVVTAIDIFSLSAESGLTVKILKQNTTTNFDIIVSEGMSHGGAGWERHQLASPFLVPNDGGTYNLGLFTGGLGLPQGVFSVRSFKNADAVGLGQAFTADAGGNIPAMRSVSQSFFIFDLTSAIQKIISAPIPQVVSLTRNGRKVFAIVTSQLISIVHPIGRHINSVQTQAITIIRSISHTIAVSIATVINLIRSYPKTYALLQPQVVTLFRGVGHRVSIVMSQLVSLITQKAGNKTFPMVQPQLITLPTRAITKIIAPIIVQAISVKRVMQHTIPAMVTTQVVSISKGFAKILSLVQAQLVSLILSHVFPFSIINYFQGQSVTLRNSTQKIFSFVTDHIVTARWSISKAVFISIPQHWTVFAGKVKVITLMTPTRVSILRKPVAKIITTSISMLVTIKPRVGKFFRATFGQSITMMRGVGKVIAIRTGQIVSIIRILPKRIAIATPQAVRLVRSVAKRLSIATAEAVTLTATRARKASISFAQAQAMTVNRSIAKVISFAQAQSVAVRRAAARSLSLVTKQAISIRRSISRTISVSWPQSVTLAKALAHRISMSTSQAVRLARSIAKLIDWNSPEAISLAHSINHSINVRWPQRLIVIRSISRRIALSMPQTVALIRRIGHRISFLNPITAAIVIGRKIKIIPTLISAQAVTLSAHRMRSRVISFAQSQSLSMRRAVSKVLTVASGQGVRLVMTFNIVRASAGRTLKNVIVRTRTITNSVIRSRVIQNIIVRIRNLP